MHTYITCLLARILLCAPPFQRVWLRAWIHELCEAYFTHLWQVCWSYRRRWYRWRKISFPYWRSWGKPIQNTNSMCTPFTCPFTSKLTNCLTLGLVLWDTVPIILFLPKILAYYSSIIPNLFRCLLQYSQNYASIICQGLYIVPHAILFMLQWWVEWTNIIMLFFMVLIGTFLHCWYKCSESCLILGWNLLLAEGFISSEESVKLLRLVCFSWVFLHNIPTLTLRFLLI